MQVTLRRVTLGFMLVLAFLQLYVIYSVQPQPCQKPSATIDPTTLPGADNPNNCLNGRAVWADCPNDAGLGWKPYNGHAECALPDEIEWLDEPGKMGTPWRCKAPTIAQDAPLAEMERGMYSDLRKQTEAICQEAKDSGTYHGLIRRQCEEMQKEINDAVAAIKPQSYTWIEPTGEFQSLPFPCPEKRRCI